MPLLLDGVAATFEARGARLRVVRLSRRLRLLLLRGRLLLLRGILAAALPACRSSAYGRTRARIATDHLADHGAACCAARTGAGRHAGCGLGRGGGRCRRRLRGVVAALALGPGVALRLRPSSAGRATGPWRDRRIAVRMRFPLRTAALLSVRRGIGCDSTWCCLLESTECVDEDAGRDQPDPAIGERVARHRHPRLSGGAPAWLASAGGGTSVPPTARYRFTRWMRRSVCTLTSVVRAA